jgi:hypothetical protein
MKRSWQWGVACAAVATLSFGVALPAGAAGGHHLLGHRSLVPGAGGTSIAMPLLFPPTGVPPIITGGLTCSTPSC